MNLAFLTSRLTPSGIYFPAWAINLLDSFSLFRRFIYEQLFRNYYCTLTFTACISWNDAQLIAPSVVSSLADIVVSNDSASDVMAGMSSGDFSSAPALVTAASHATQAISTVINQQPDPMVLIALLGILKSVASTNAAASYLGGNPAVMKVSQCGDAMKLTRNVLPWPEGWAIVQNPELPNYPGMLNCYITDGVQYVPMTVTTTV